MSERTAEYADFIIYADESGDHGLESIDPQFPVFALVFCVFEKAHYINVIEPRAKSIKHKWFGHDCVVFHEREIRKQTTPFEFLKGDPARRADFFADLDDLMGEAEFHWFATIVDKHKLQSRYRNPWNPYETAMHLCLERVWRFLCDAKQEGRRVHVIFESRGAKEDRELELEFRRVVSNEAHWGWRKCDFTRFKFEPVFVAKAANCAGHQISDMIARPLALKALRPEQPNRATELIWPKKGYFKAFP